LPVERLLFVRPQATPAREQRSEFPRSNSLVSPVEIEPELPDLNGSKPAPELSALAERDATISRDAVALRRVDPTSRPLTVHWR